MILSSFLGFLALFLVIGLLSFFKRKNTTEDYLIAGKSVSPLLVGLSAIATNNSGFLFVGMIGFSYTSGLGAALWFMLGWICGDVAAQLISLRKIQETSRKSNIQSYGGLLSHWNNTNYQWLRRLVGLFTILFLTVYAAAQLKAGTKATEALLGWSPELGIWVSALIVLAYSMAGGIRASIWTDVAQSIVMIVGVLLLMFAGIQYLGGVSQVLTDLSQVEPGYIDIFPDKTPFYIALYIAGWFFGGFGVLGQPHIVIRFMSLDDASNINKMRFYYYIWFVVLFSGAIAVGLLARLIFPEVGSFDKEIAFANMALQLLHPVFIGLILAALFAAAMSTADSLILACSAAVTRDIFPTESQNVILAKIATLSVLAIAMWITLSGQQSVFDLVVSAWGMLASAFVPLVIAYSIGRKIPEWLAIATVLVGFTSFVIWYQAGLHSTMYSTAPGILGGLMFYFIASVFIKPKQTA
jgi:SSS family transporter